MRVPAVVWPTSKLRCLNINSHNLELASEVEVLVTKSLLVPFERLSGLLRLIGAAGKAVRLPIM